MEFFYDEADRVVQIQGVNGDLTDLVYDDGGRLAEVIRSDDTSFQFTYDPPALMTAKTTPDGKTYRYTYNERIRTHHNTETRDTFANMPSSCREGHCMYGT